MFENFADNWYYQSVVVNWQRVFPSLIIAALLAVSVAVLFVLGRRRRAWRFLAVYALLFLVVYAFPPAVYILRKLTRNGSVYWRMFWILPWTVIIAAAPIGLAARLKDRLLKVLIIAMTAVLIVMAGNQVYVGNDRAYQKADNREKVPFEAKETVAMIYENEGVNEKASVRIAVPPQMTPYIRQLDGTITMPYGRDLTPPRTAETPGDQLLFCLRGDESFKPAIVELLRENHCGYVVVYSDQGYDSYLESGARLMGRTGNYELWEMTG